MTIPFRTAVEAGDLDGAIATLADVVLHSPMTFHPFQGKDSGGLLYRVDAEVLIGMVGQPDLRWDEFDPSEVRPAPPEVVAADASRSHP
jgi:hypothetical protein